MDILSIGPIIAFIVFCFSGFEIGLKLELQYELLLFVFLYFFINISERRASRLTDIGNRLIYLSLGMITGNIYYWFGYESESGQGIISYVLEVILHP